MLVAGPPDRRDRAMRERRDLVSYTNVTLNLAFQQSLNCELLSCRSASANELQILFSIIWYKDLPFKSRIQDRLVGQLQESLMHVGVAIR
jgi:hypothetical protein